MGTVKRGDIYMVDLSPVVGSEQGGYRPCLVIQNNIGNRFSPTVKVAAISSQTHKAKLPTHVPVKAHQVGLERDSIIMLEQVRTIDKKRLSHWKARLDDAIMEEVFWAYVLSCANDQLFNQMLHDKSKSKAIVAV